MTDTRHTPGPWRAKTSRVIVAPRSHTNVLGETTHYEGEVASTQPVPKREGGEPTRLANARLIAAAPDLLAACIDALEVECDMAECPDSELAQRLRAAIAKATGEEHTA